MAETLVPIGRFAPTPSGQMHAGNLLCALLAYLSVKSKGGKFLVRIEDLDAARCPRSSADEILSTLDKLGLVSDSQPLWQSERGKVYRQKEQMLAEKATVYPCFCTRSQLHSAQAPRLSDGGIIYGGTCRDLTPDELKKKLSAGKPCYRVTVPDITVSFTDGIVGEVSQNLKAECGDFILRRSDGVYAYQFAVSVDDGESGVTEVVRGDDLVLSTPRQIWLLRLLGYRVPKYYHIPLVCAPDGRKLSKSEGDSAARIVNSLPPQKIFGALAYAAGLREDTAPVSLDELTAEFSWDKVRKGSMRLPEILWER